MKKRALSLMIVLSLLMMLPLPAMASNLPDCFVPTTMMIGFNTRLPDLLKTLGNADPAGATAKYLLSNPEMGGNSMRFSNDDGTVVLDANAGPTSTATRMTLTIGSGVNAFDATALKMAFLGSIADSDAAVAYEDLVSWLTGDGDSLSLDGYYLSYERKTAMTC